VVIRSAADTPRSIGRAHLDGGQSGGSVESISQGRASGDAALRHVLSIALAVIFSHHQAQPAPLCELVTQTDSDDE